MIVDLNRQFFYSSEPKVFSLAILICFLFQCKPADEGVERQGNPFKDDPERRNLVSAGERKNSPKDFQSNNDDSTAKNPCQDFDINDIPKGYKNKRKACQLHSAFENKKLKVTLSFDESESSGVSGYCFDFQGFKASKAYTLKKSGDIKEEEEKETCIIYEFVSTANDKKCREGEYGVEIYCKGILDISCSEDRFDGTLNNWVSSEDKSYELRQQPCK